VSIDAHRLVCEPRTSGATYLSSLLEEWRDTGVVKPVLLLPHPPAEGAVHSPLIGAFPYLCASKAFDPSASLRAQLRWTQVTLPRLIRKAGADVYFSPFHLTPIATRGKTVSTIHDLCFLDEPRFRGYVVHRFSLATALTKATRLIAVSGSTEDQLKKFRKRVSSRVTRVYNGVAPRDPKVVPESRSDTSSLGRSGYVLWVGSFTPRKNPHLVVEVERKLDAPFVALVPPRDLERARDAFSHRARVVSGLPPDERDAVLQDAALLLFPSACEGFGYPAVEAMRFGVPVVCLSNGAVAELVGGIVPPAPPDAERLAEVCRALLALAEGERSSLAARLVARSSEFSTRAMAEGTAKVLEAAAAG
jgi:glycosyltransferase involved in cell wall biosynthesis